MKINLSLKDELLSAIRRIVAKFWAQEVGQSMHLQSVGYHANFGAKIGIRSRIASRMLLSTLLMLLTFGVGSAWGTDYSYDFTEIDFSTWSTSYESHTVSYTEADVVFTSADKQNSSSTIDDRPVTKGQPVELKLKSSVAEDYYISAVTFTCKQWGSKAQTITLHYSTDGGSNYTSTGTTSTNFSISKSSLSSSTDAVKITFSSTSNQVGISSVSFTLTAKGGGSTPTITKSSSMTTFGYNLSTGVATKQSFTVSGTNLSGNLTVTPPTGYEVSTSENGTYQTTALSFTPSTGTVSTQTIWVRLKAIADLTAGTKEGNIVCASTGASTQNVAVSGSVPFTVTWKANGETHATTYVAYATAPGTALGSLPSDPETSCGGKVLYGWYEGDYSDASIAPSVVSTSTKITADKTYNAVYANRSGSSKTYEFDITPSQFNTTSYAANNNQKSSTATATDASGATMTVKWTSNQIMKSSSNMQWQKNTSYIYNDTDLGTVNSVTITKTAGGYNTTYGTTSHPTSGAQGSGNGYFTVKENNTATGTVSLVRVNYTVSSYVYSDYSTTCGTCSENPTVGVAALKGSFSLTSVGVTCPTTGTSVGTNCSWTDYGFVWSESVANPTLVEATGNASTNCTKVQVGTSGTVSTWDGSLTKSSFELGHTYKYRAYGKNGYASGSYQYGTVATFTPRSVTFNLNSHGTSAPSTQYVNNGGKVSNPSYSESVTGWRFDGWYGNAACTGNAWSFADSIVTGANRTLYAKWTQVYTVTYAYAGGSSSCSDDTKYAAGATVTICATEPTKSGSTFLGWLGDNSIGTKAANSTFTMPAANVTLTAQWADAEYTLTQTAGSHIAKGHTGTVITSGMTEPSGLSLTYSISDDSYALPKTISLSGGGKASWALTTDYTWTVSADKHSATLLIKPTTISGNLTVTVTEKARYTVVWDRPGDGNDETEYYAADDNSVTMKTGESDCGTKKFYCWTENPGSLSPTPTAASSGNISGNKTYTAVYGDRSGGEGFEKVTSIVDGATYYIATGLTSSDYGCGGQNGNNSYADAVALSAATFNGSSVLTAFPSGVKAITVAVSGNYFSMHDGTKYLTLSTDANYLEYTNSVAYVWELTASNYYIKPKDYNRWLMRNGTRFACYSNAQDKSYAYLYKPAVSWSNFSTSCALYEINIDTPDGGTVTTLPASETGAGQTVTVNVTPNSCKYLSALKYNDGSDHAISIASTPYTFTMPASDVTVTATFSDKTVSSIAPNTNTHRTLMQSTLFVGEQITVTYNDGSTEVLDWDDATLTFSGYNMSTLGDQTVRVDYDGACGDTYITYDIEVVDGVPITFSDCGVTTVVKYDPGATVPVESRTGSYGCSGWTFLGWSATSVAHNSTTGFTYVYNFTASTPRTLYAVYVNTENSYSSIDDLADLNSGANYVFLRNYSSGNWYTPTAVAGTGDNANYLVAQNIYSNVTYSSPVYSMSSPAASYVWQLQGTAGNWYFYNASTNKYLDISTDNHIVLSSTRSDNFTITQDAYNDDEFAVYSNTNAGSNKYLSYNSSHFKGYTSSGTMYMLRQTSYFSSNPPCAPRSVTFYGNGGTVTAYGGGSSGGTLVITEAERDAGIKLPTASFSDCEGKTWTFMGWLDEERDLSRVPVLTTELLEDGVTNANHSISADDEEYWAVYSSTGEEETKHGTMTFVATDFPSSYSTGTLDKVVNGDTYEIDYKKVGYPSGSGNGIQIGKTDEYDGHIQNNTSLGKINYIRFNTFNVGSISSIHVYVGTSSSSIDTELTSAELQTIGSEYTFYPNGNYSYFKIQSAAYTGISSISVAFGLGTAIYATTPDCSTISLSGDIYVTSKNGVGIMAVTPLEIEAHQLTANADVVITSNSSNVYFSTDRTPNFSKASKPTASVTVRANASGELSATPIYVHYKPSSTGTGAASDVMVYANLSTPDPNIKGEHTIHVRNLPEKVVIAAKVGGAYYALPADMSGATNPEGVLIAVNEANMTATAPKSCTYTIWPVKTTSGSGDRYALHEGNAYGERVRFSAPNNTIANAGLWANNSTSSGDDTKINNNAAIASISADPAAAYEWKITTTVTDGKWSHTLQTDQSNNTRYLRYWTAASGGPKWGTYVSGEQNLYLLPVTEVTPFDAKVTEWGKNSAVFDVYPKVDETLANKVIAYIGASNSGAKDVTETTTSVKGTSSKYNYTINFGNDIDFSANEGATLRLDWKNNETLLGYSVIVIPTIIAEDANLHDIDEYKTHWESKDVHVLPGNTLTVDAGSFENHGVTIGTLEIYPGATVKVTKGSAESGTLTATNLILRNGWTRAGSKSYDVARLYIPSEGTLNATNVYSDWYIDFDQYYPIAVPWNVTVANMSYLNSTNAASAGVKLRYYDGESRASNVQSGVGESANWKEYGATGNLSTPATLTPGVGYAMTARRPTGKAFSIIRMPLTIPSASWTTNGEQGSVTVDDVTTHKDQVIVTAHGDDNTPTYAKGWNFIANPYMSLYNGTLSYDENNTIEYANIPDINFQEYSQVPINNTTKLKPSSAFLVQASITGTATFATDSRVAAAPSYRNAGTATTPTQKAYILLADEQTEDMMGILVSEKYTADYELNADLEKLLSDGNTLRTYMRYNDMNMAYLAINEELAKQLIPVSVRIPAEGEYTFRIHEASIADELEGIYLTDYQTNTVTNLLYDSYTFNAVAGTDNVRFAINAVIGKREVPTGVDISDSDKDRPTKFIWNDKVYILHNNVIYDSTGKRVNVINK